MTDTTSPVAAPSEQRAALERISALANSHFTSYSHACETLARIGEIAALADCDALLAVPEASLHQVRQIIRRAIVTRCVGDDLDTTVWYAADLILTGKSKWPKPSFSEEFIVNRDAS